MRCANETAKACKNGLSLSVFTQKLKASKHATATHQETGKVEIQFSSITRKIATLTTCSVYDTSKNQIKPHWAV